MSGRSSGTSGSTARSPSVLRNARFFSAGNPERKIPAHERHVIMRYIRCKIVVMIEVELRGAQGRTHTRDHY
jgi:hypothetical protein